MTNEVMPLEALDLKVTPAHVELAGIEKLKELARNRIEELRTYPVQEETYKGAKAFKAEQNKAAKIVHDFRMQMKSDALGNVEDLDADLLAFEKELKDGAGEIGGRLTEYDEKKKQDKLIMVQAEIEKIAAMHNIQADKVEVNQSWLNKTYSWPKMQEEIETQVVALAAEQKTLLANTDNVEMYAKMNHLEPDGFVAMIVNGSDVTTVRAAMDNAVKARRLDAEVKEAKREEARRIHEEAVAKAKTIGDKQVNVETGELIEEWQEPTSTYQYTFKNMTREQKEWLDTQLRMAFANQEINFVSKEV